ncbi:MAG: hypothetical protein COU71_00210 [Parcubacteria group bacterium CG10_big_fil_rev_8_21_14_0_10_38_31]|uniref:Second mannosyl transferase n=1 Tax=Candidatus Falkowbacteria bacterium CG11_big_fil_rev_8_21_14_0_20_39_10 TaxID=1974570 RepID=A0A2M6KAF6_9BACT|nr:MAG: hypothetical protein COV49_00145 [Candidatus Falkowbacteria bacterium CG11_big_fil_rev_8_21_14_0_20_39_10]PIR58162.1 MAG: hypothetical protein COU71_00210 [Parcubacteria group bacterium CG10_big_fil_rev_8_21_14_0_10_38_31]
MKEDRKKKIIYLITKSSWGGATRYVFDLATNLSKDDFEVVVASGGEGVLNDKLKDMGIRTISIKKLSRDVSLIDEVRVFFNLIKIFKEERPDIVHLNSSKAGAIGSLSAKIAGVPKIIFTAHGWAFNEGRPIWQKTLIKIFVLVTLIFQDNIICVSEQTRSDIKNFPFIQKKIRVIYNGISEIPFLGKSEARIALDNLSIVSIDKKIVWLGAISELHKNKGLEYAIKAISLLKDYPVVFVIMGSGELRKDIEDMIKREKLEQRVVLLGFVSDAKRYLKAFDIFLLPSITEAFPYVVIEAGMAGLPVVASSVGGVSDIISDDCGVLVKPRDYRAIETGLKNLLNDREKGERLGFNLNQRVVKNFSFQGMLSKTINTYM